jgi:hypothetical protein
MNLIVEWYGIIDDPFFCKRQYWLKYKFLIFNNNHFNNITHQNITLYEKI